MNLRLGKHPAKRDKRNIKMAKILDTAKLPPIPDSWDVDKALPFKVPEPEFCNVEWSCCVISARAHQTLRFEGVEQGRALNILDSQILDEYWREQGGDSHTKPDNGLVVLESIKLWRSRGWLSKPYSIYAFAEINHRRKEQVKAAMYLLSGVYGGVVLTQSGMDQIDRGEPWTITASPGQVVGGHALYWKAFTPEGITCITWGREQFATWDWFYKFTDELYGVVDNRDRFLKTSPVDVGKLDKYLKAVVTA